MSLQVFCVGVSSLPLAEGPVRDSDLNLLYCTLLHSYGSYQMGVGVGVGQSATLSVGTCPIFLLFTPIELLSPLSVVSHYITILRLTPVGGGGGSKEPHTSQLSTKHSSVLPVSQHKKQGPPC